MTALRVDEPSSAPAGDALDAAALAGWLSDVLGLAGAVEVRQFPRGFSNLTYLVTVGGTPLVLRRPPAGVGAGSAHDMLREARVLRAVASAGVPVPEVLATCESPAILGAPFYVMRRVEGVILRGVTAEVREALAPPMLRGLCERFVETLAAVHGTLAAVPALAELGRAEGYVRRQVDGWSARWRKAQTDEVPAMDALASWLSDHAPQESGAALVHNDFKFDNLVLDSRDVTRIAAVLDWELATVGDPLLDLGTALGYWLEADDPPALMGLGLGVTALPGALTRAEVWDRYGERRGIAMPPLAWYHAFGLFKIAVIAQQIYARWQAGLAPDPRFGQLLGAVRLLADAGTRAARGTAR